MIKPTLPANESERLAALARYAILDTPPDPAFDELTALAALICETPIALVTLVDENRQWFKSRLGLEAGETPRDVAFCAHAIHGRELFEVQDAASDARFADNPLVLGDPNIRFYAGAPLTNPDGLGLGTLCVIDRVPRVLTDAQRAALAVLSRAVATQLELRRAVTEQREAEETLRQFFRLSQDLLSIASFEGVYLDVNDAFSRQLGWEPADVRRRRYIHFVHPDDRAKAIAEANRLAATGSTSAFECRFLQKDGGHRWLRWNVTADGDRQVFYAVGRDVTAERAERERLHHEALHDPLTGLANRTQLVATLGRCLARSSHLPPTEVAVIYLDLDGFKAVNDTHGHAAGDALLFEVGRRLREAVRPGDPIARLGGDEFAIVLDGLHPAEPLASIASRVLEQLTAPYTLGDVPLVLGASLGIATSGPGDDPASLLAAADTAMYDAKKAGGRRFAFATRNAAP